MTTTKTGTVRVKDLIVMLAEMPQNAVVVMASDAEGNNYETLYGAETGRFRTVEAGGAGYVEMMARGGKACVVLYPNG